MRNLAAHPAGDVAKTRPMIIERGKYYRDKVIALLANEKLPVADLPDALDNFVVAMEDTVVIGAAGLEIYGAYGLLRSLAISEKYRGKGVANKLLEHIEVFAALKALKEIYLFTETAPGYFERKGYGKITRADVPAGVQQSSEFRHICPASAAVMKKKL